LSSTEMVSRVWGSSLSHHAISNLNGKRSIEGKLSKATVPPPQMGEMMIKLESRLKKTVSAWGEAGVFQPSIATGRRERIQIPREETQSLRRSKIEGGGGLSRSAGCKNSSCQWIWRERENRPGTIDHGWEYL